MTPRVEIDPRVELITAVEAVAKGPGCGDGQPYLEAVRAWGRKKHPAFERFKAMGAAAWRHRHPALILFDFGPPPGLEVQAYRDHYANAGAGDALAAFMKDLRALAAERPVPEPGEVVVELAAEGLPADVEAYLGAAKTARYHLVLAPLLHGSLKHNVLYRRDDGTFDIYSICGHEEVRAGRPVFRCDQTELAVTVWHELCHTIVDDITQKHAEALRPLEPLYGLMTGLAATKYRGPQGWLHMVDENVIRAVTSRLARKRYGERAGRAALEKEKKDGFALVGPIYELLAVHERKGGTLESFYPRIVELLSRVGAGAKR